MTDAGPRSLPFHEHTARATREPMTALVTEDDTDALAAQVAEIAARLSAAAADPHAVEVVRVRASGLWILPREV